MEGRIILKYDGGSAAKGEMDAYAVADAIRSFADFTRALGVGLYGKNSQTKVRVAASRPGSHEIVFYYQIVEASAAMVSVMSGLPSPGDLWALAKDCFALIKHLQGEPPKRLQKAGDGAVMVENNQGTINNFAGATVNLIMQPRVSRAASGFVRRPLTACANRLDILQGDEVITSANDDEARSFVPLDCSNVLTTHTAEVYLTVATAVLEGGARWKFSDGRNTFPVEIEDIVFMDRVMKGEERFGKGDTLLVRLRSVQKKDQGQLRAEYTIEEVLEHVMFSDIQVALDGV